MRVSLLLLATFTVVVIGSVAVETEHYIDALRLSDFMEEQDYDPVIQIGSETFQGPESSYIISFYDEWYDESTSLAKILCAAMGVGAVSSQTSWSSDYCFVLFEDAGCRISSDACRDIYDLTTAGENGQVQLQFMIHSVFSEFGLQELW